MQPDTVTLIANFIPFQKPDGGPNFYSFDPNVVYEIHIDNNGDAVEDITYQWRFTTEVRNPATFLYNTGPVTSLDDPDLNVRQFYRLTRIDGPRRTGTVTELSGRLPVPPPNIGPRSTPNYGALGGGIQTLPGNMRVFAGQRDEGFYVDLGIFDLLGVGSGTVEDSTAGFNVSSLAIRVPKSALARGGATPTSAERSERHHRRVVDGQPLCDAHAVGRRADAQRRARAGVAPRQSARQRSGDRSRAQGCVQRHRADERRGGARSRHRSGSAEAVEADLQRRFAAGAAQRSGDDLPDRHPRTRISPPTSAPRKCCA